MARVALPVLFAAPHRLPFLVGTLNLLVLAVWWLLHLADTQLALAAMAQGDLPRGTLHGLAMLYLAVPPFVFGFLLTVFPRWMDYPDLEAPTYGPVAVLLAAGSLAVHAGLWTGADVLLAPGLGLFALGWLGALRALLAVARRNARDAHPPCWHAFSALAALGLGGIGLLAAIGFLLSLNTTALLVAGRLGLTGFVLPIFLTVAHRMLPFFAGNVVAGYVRWRPDWLLAALWGLLVLRLGSELAGLEAGRALANLGLAGLTATMAWKWWPRAPAPGLLNVLVWGFAWAPTGFALAALAAAGVPLGRAPDHALMIGLAGSLLVAMVTRVTQGHSGRPLAMPLVAWLAFGALQLAAATRMAAAVRDEDGAILLVAAGLFSTGLFPWGLRHALIYVRRRRDGKPG